MPAAHLAQCNVWGVGCMSLRLLQQYACHMECMQVQLQAEGQAWQARVFATIHSTVVGASGETCYTIEDGTALVTARMGTDLQTSLFGGALLAMAMAMARGQLVEYDDEACLGNGQQRHTAPHP